MTNSQEPTATVGVLAAHGHRIQLRTTQGMDRSDSSVVVVGLRTTSDGHAELVPDGAIDDVAATLGESALAMLPGRAADAGSVTDLGPMQPSAANLILVGLGSGSETDIGKAGAAVGRRLTTSGGQVRLTREFVGSNLRIFFEHLLLAAYRLKPTDSAQDADIGFEVAGSEAEDILGTAIADAAGVWTARELTNTPANIANPPWLADQAVQRAQQQGLSAQVRDEQWLEGYGAGGLLGVAAGSQYPPLLVEVRYEPDHAQRHVALIGKGITFDSGGLSLKPGESMKPMKSDMAGSATVLGAVLAAARRQAPVQITAILALAENMPSGNATRPGDVLTHPGGLTTEVLNTDAEGRLVLADAMDYACDRLQPDVLLDVATLTGAARVALGRGAAPVFGNHDGLADQVIAAGGDRGEMLWRLPLEPDYSGWLESTVADQANIATTEPGAAGAIIAAIFLERFCADRPWLHIDIAGAGRSLSTGSTTLAGSTGFGVRALTEWLCRGAPL